MTAQREAIPVTDGSSVLHDEPMAHHTSWRVGGRADVYFRPRSREELAGFLRRLDPRTPVHWVGLGSNLLVRDGGVRGVVIATTGGLRQLRHLGDGLVEAEAGVTCSALARHCVRWQVGPAEFFAGIPGTVGGALAMNAGAFGGETWQHVVEVDVMDHGGNLRCRRRADYQAGYREVRGPAGEWFVAARFGFDAQRPSRSETLRAILRERKARQPVSMPSCGSVFRNPPGDFAGRLIETAGLKGMRIGGAQVSELHANFIVNTGAATAADIEALIAHVQAVVAERHGVRLRPEVHVLGEAVEERQ